MFYIVCFVLYSVVFTSSRKRELVAYCCYPCPCVCLYSSRFLHSFMVGLRSLIKVFPDNIHLPFGDAIHVFNKAIGIINFAKPFLDFMDNTMTIL